jgi:hypothetical protein
VIGDTVLLNYLIINNKHLEDDIVPPLNQKDQPLSLQDLTILMEAYKNNIELSTTLHEQNKHILAQQEEIIKSLENLSAVMSSTAEKYSVIQKEIHDCIRTHDKDFNTIVNSLILSINDKYGSLKTLLYVAYAGLGAIILTLLGMVANLLTK